MSSLPVSRGLLRCPSCNLTSMVRTDTISNDIPAEAGSIVREQIYACQTPACGEIVKIDHVARGRFGKKFLRS